MKSPTVARIAAWNVIADQELPAGTKVTVKDGQVTIHRNGAQPASVRYTPADTPASVRRALTDALQAADQPPRQQAHKRAHTASERSAK